MILKMTRKELKGNFKIAKLIKLANHKSNLQITFTAYNKLIQSSLCHLFWQCVLLSALYFDSDTVVN